jgi:methyl-accepting chemotaxis protein
MNKLKIYAAVSLFILFVLALGAMALADIPFALRAGVLFLAFAGAGLFLILSLKKSGKYEEKIMELENMLEERRIRLKTATGEGQGPVQGAGGNGSKVVGAEAMGKLKGLITTMHNTCATTMSSINAKLDTLKLNEIVDDELKQRITSTESNFAVISSNIKKAFNIADNLADSAEKAFKSSENVQGKIKLVTDALGGAISFATQLFEQSKKIGKIIEIMGDIADKIHILSINASIVSARAGEHGKAFEVVSREIRKLAYETEASLKDIEGEVFATREISDLVVDKINLANTQILAERDSLISVIGSLQGITLGVEVLRAVSKMANEKTVQQGEVISSFVKKFLELHGLLSEAIRIKDDVTNMTNVENEFTNLNKLIDSKEGE